MLVSVDALSDDEQVPGEPPPPVAVPPRKYRRLEVDSAAVQRSEARTCLSNTVKGRCPCAKKSKKADHHNCFRPFQMEPDLFNKLLHLREEEVRNLQKADADLKATRH